MPVLTMSDRVISAKADTALAKIEEQNHQIADLQGQLVAQNQIIIEGQRTTAKLIESHKEMMQVLLFVVRNVDGDVDNMLNILQRQHGE